MRKSRRELRAIARQIIAEAGQKPPIDIAAVARGRGLRIREEPLEPSVSGVLVMHDDGRAVIAVNGDHHPNRQRFSIAHELAHFLLHRYASRAFIDDHSRQAYFRDERASQGLYEQEIDANYLAAEILMPRDWLQKDLVGGPIDPSNEEEVSRLARKYGVSQQAMSIRLTNLGFIAVGEG